MNISQLISVFATGLLAGGLTCMAVQGGLLTTMIAKKQYDTRQTGETKKAILGFLSAKIIAYTVLGFLLGWFGSLLQISIPFQIVLFVVVGIYMLMTALHMLSVHPIFRYASIQPPHFVTKLIRSRVKSTSVLGPAFLGAFTIFIPCGTTQAIMALCIASGSPLTGAALLFAFTLGTSPLFFILGYATLALGEKMSSVFVKVAAILIIFFGISTLHNAWSLTGTSYTLDKLLHASWCFLSYCDVPQVQNVVSNQTITILDDGYSPTMFSVSAGEPVTILLKNEGGTGCTQAFTIPKLGIQKIVSQNSQETITFVAPQEKQELYFMCSMGMYRGTIKVI